MAIGFPKVGFSHAIGPTAQLSGFSDTAARFVSDDGDASPRPGHAETVNSVNTEGDKEEEVSPRAWSTPLPLPGIVAEEGTSGTQRRVSESAAGYCGVVPGEVSSPLLPRQMSRMTGDTEMTRFREELPPDLKLAAAWRKKTSGTTSKVARRSIRRGGAV
eukprot:Skav215065  [mRNA]  locus=scaffold1303:146299:158553:+ [translate_table: standard]